MGPRLLQRLWSAAALLLAGAVVMIVWPSRGPSVPTAYRLERIAPQTAADVLLLGHHVNLNCAEAAQLEVLPGIGPALAARIVRDRERRGFFPSVSAIERVVGIGPALRHRMTPFVMVGACPDNS